jgi:hypothetical protein
MEGINMGITMPELIFGFNLNQLFTFSNNFGFFFQFC